MRYQATGILGFDCACMHGLVNMVHDGLPVRAAHKPEGQYRGIQKRCSESPPEAREAELGRPEGEEQAHGDACHIVRRQVDSRAQGLSPAAPQDTAHNARNAVGTLEDSHDRQH